MRVPAPPHDRLRRALLLALLVLAAWPAGSAPANTIAVNFAADTAANDGRCSLREAVRAANTHAVVYAAAGECAAGSANDTILLPAGTFKLAIPGDDDTSLKGDLDITDARLTISGAGAAVTTIDGNHLDRVLDVQPNTAVRLQGVRVTGGRAPDGAKGADGIGRKGSTAGSGLPATFGRGTAGVAGGDGGGIRNRGSLTVADSIVAGNAAGSGGIGGIGRGGDGDVVAPAPEGSDASFGVGGEGGSGGSGGGIFSSGTLTVVRTVVSGNAAGAGGASSTGTGGQGGSGNIYPGARGGGGQSMGAGTGGSGGGIALIGTATLTIDRSSIATNAAGAGGNGGLGQGGAGGATGGTRQSGGDGGPGNGGAGGAGGDGGGVFAGAKLVLTNSLVAGNKAGSGGAGGNATGGVGGVATMSMATGGNGGVAQSGVGGRAGFGGGVEAGSLTAANITITGNATGAGAPSGAAAGGRGGGVVTGGTGGNGGATTVVNGGDGGEAGGLDVKGGGTIRHATITANTLAGPGAVGSATAGPGGAAVTPGMSPAPTIGVPGADATGGAMRTGPGVTLANSIVAGNALLSCGAAVGDGGHNIAVPDGSCPGARVDPLLAPLAANGGPTRTQALRAGSPAIDRVPATGAGCPSIDQRGIARPQGRACDAGAFEVAVPGSGGVGPGGVVLAVVGKLKLSPRAFRAAARGASLTAAAATAAAKRGRTGTTVTFTLNEAATVRFAVARPRSGRAASGGRCVKKTKRNRHARRCTRLVKLSGSFTRAGSLGTNRVHFTGRLRHRKLEPGSYRLVLTPSAGGKAGKASTAAFRIVR